MKILILPDAQKAVARAVEITVEAMGAKPAAVLGLATGGTMVPYYAALVAAVRAGRVSLAQATTFNLDEYVGLPPDDPHSYRAFMNAHLFDPLGLPAERTHLPRGDAPDPAAGAERYEAAIAAAGGIDLQLLGIGENGHIGFNEPGSSLTAGTRVKTLWASTRKANARFFENGPVPRFAITMGVGTILKSRHALVLATGERKAAAVAAMIEGPVSARTPASALQLHPRASVVIDAQAAADLELRADYEAIHPGGGEPPL